MPVGTWHSACRSHRATTQGPVCGVLLDGARSIRASTKRETRSDHIFVPPSGFASVPTFSAESGAWTTTLTGDLEAAPGRDPPLLGEDQLHRVGVFLARDDLARQCEHEVVAVVPVGGQAVPGQHPLDGEGRTADREVQWSPMLATRCHSCSEEAEVGQRLDFRVGEAAGLRPGRLAEFPQPAARVNVACRRPVVGHGALK